VLFEGRGSYRLAQDWTNALATLDALLAVIEEPDNSQGLLLRGDYMYLLEYGYTYEDCYRAFAHENA
jgi:hypothetical protein